MKKFVNNTATRLKLKIIGPVGSSHRPGTLILILSARHKNVCSAYTQNPKLSGSSMIA